MKFLFIEAKYLKKINIPYKLIELLPKKIGLISTIQFCHQLDSIKKQLKGKKVYIRKGKQKYPGQILGCDISSAKKIKNKVDAFLYIGSGEFHPINVSLGKPIFVYNPITNLFKKLNLQEKKKKGAYLKFLSSRNIGILVSTKPGQYNLKAAFNFKKKHKEKNCYIFIADEIKDLENFPFIECWVNTACPRINGTIPIDILRKP